MLRVYLAGPINGLTIKEATGWRDELVAKLNNLIHFYNPMAGKEKLVPPGHLIVPEAYDPDLSYLHSSPAVFKRDLYMIDNSDWLFVNLEKVKGVSVGTFVEIGYAHARGIPVILVGSRAMLNHPFIAGCCVGFLDLIDAKRYLVRLALDEADATMTLI